MQLIPLEILYMCLFGSVPVLRLFKEVSVSLSNLILLNFKNECF